jgi:hypothetical protein
MAASHSSNRMKKLQINPPTNFTGNQDDLENFMFLYMTEGTACAWKEVFVQDVINSQGSNFRTLRQFIINLKKAFKASDAEGDARAKLRQLKQGKDLVDDYVAQFRILARRDQHWNPSKNICPG